MKDRSLDIIYDMFYNPKTKFKSKSQKTRMSHRGLIVDCPSRLSLKIINAIKKSKYKLAREMIDIYKDMFITNF